MSHRSFRRAWTLAWAAGALLATPLASTTAHACRCMVPPGPKEAMAKVDAVFLGKVVTVGKGRTQKTFGITVDRYFKGVVGRRANVTTGAHPSSCGYPFRRGSEYLVYATKSKGLNAFRTTSCTRTRSRQAADDDLRVLGGGTRPRASGRRARNNYSAGKRSREREREYKKRAVLPRHKRRPGRRPLARHRMPTLPRNGRGRSMAGEWSGRGRWPVTFTLKRTGGTRGEDEKGTFTKTDRVSPCPRGARCIWLGIVTNQGTYYHMFGMDSLKLSYSKPDNRASVTTPETLDVQRGTLIERLRDGSRIEYRRVRSGGSGVRCGPATCSKGQVCCNASCGICTAQGASCTKQLCAAPRWRPQAPPAPR